MDDSYSMQLNMRKAALIAGLSLFAGSLFAQSRGVARAYGGDL